MFRSAAVLGLVAIFLATILCAVICPGREAHAANHVCDKPDHSCCPKSNNRSTDSQCLDTHFVEASKYHHPSLHLAELTIEGIDTTQPSATVTFVAWVEQLAGPPQDLLHKHRALRI
jgi:hypothetical protein